MSEPLLYLSVQTLENLGHSKADAAAPELLAKALLGLVANIAQRPHSIWLAAGDTARSRMDSVFKVCVFECHPVQAITCDHLCSMVLYGAETLALLDWCAG